MKIGINASFARKPDSGMGQVTLNFLRKLAEFKAQGDKCKGMEFILYLEEDLPESLKLPDGFEKRIFLPLYRRDDLIRKIRWEKRLLPKMAKKDGCDLLLSLYQSATVTKEMRHIMFVHDMVWKIFPKYLNNLRKRTYYRLVDKAIKAAGKIATNSLNSQKDISKFFEISGRNIPVMPLDCDSVFKKEYTRQETDVVLKRYNLPKDYIFYVGGFDIRKNIRNLIEAYALFWKKYHKEASVPNLVLAGEFNANLTPLVTDIPVAIRHVHQKYAIPEDKIMLIGFVEQKDLPMLYRGAKLFCYPSLYEGFGLPVLEALNSGCPVVTSNVSSIPEIVNEREALLVDPRQSENIAGAINTILSNDALRQEKIENGRRKAAKFSWDKFADSMLKLITDADEI